MHEKWIEMLINMPTKYLYYEWIMKYLLCDCKHILVRILLNADMRRMLCISRIMHIVKCRYENNVMYK